MYTSFKNSLQSARVRTAIFLWLLPVFGAFSTQCCNAAQALSLTSPNQALIGWTSGPADASLGTLADIKISKGYRFTDAGGASDLLARMNNPIPQGLVGILAPESGQWWAVLTYKDIGYVKNADKDQIDAAGILKAISDRTQRQNEDRTIHNLPPINSVDWKYPPAFDAKTHTVEWAVQVKTQSAQIINHTMCLLGRQGVLDATVVEPFESGTDLAPLRELMKNISFKPGQLYKDYQKGDTVADIGLAGLIAGADDSMAPKNAVATAAKSAGVWGWYGYVGIGVLAGGGVLLLRGAFRRKARRALSTAPAANAISNGNGIGNGEAFRTGRAATTLPGPGALGNGHATGDVKPGNVELGDIKRKEEAIRTIRKVAVVRNGSNHRPGARRKKTFDYHRFYTDTVMKLSSGAYTEVSTSNGRTNGNGRVNGHSSGQPIESQPPTHGDANQALVQAHLDLIANQKELIEEQKRLMIQQAKLIDEKSKLIAEKSQLLDRQTELFERDIL
jgi:uncharacterized membrane-anchored protein